MNSVSEEVYGRLLVREQLLRIEPQPLECDLLIWCSSWEDRSLVGLECYGTRAKQLLEFGFYPSHAPSAKSDSSQAIIDGAAKQYRYSKCVLGPSVDYFHNANRMKEQIEKTIRDLPNGFLSNIIIDISSLPKSYAMSLCGYFFNYTSAPSITFVYCAASYGGEISATQSGVVRGQEFNLSRLGRFTQGPWNILPIPNMRTNAPITAGVKLIAFCGGDEDRLIEELQRREPWDRYVVIARADSAHSQEDAEVRAKNIVEFTPLESERIYYCTPQSVVTSMAVAVEIANSAPDQTEILFLPLSTKPHAIAAALLCIVNKRMSCVARVPTSYVPRAAQRGTQLLSTRVIDLSSPIAGRFLD